MALRHPAPSRNDRTRRRGGGWLAIVALLVNTLLPAALLLVAGPAQDRTATLFCGRAPGQLPPEQHSPGQHPAAVPHHCALCLAGVAGPTPPETTLVPPPLPVVTAALTPVVGEAPRSAPLTAALPRGPPDAA